MKYRMLEMRISAISKNKSVAISSYYLFLSQLFLTLIDLPHGAIFDENPKTKTNDKSEIVEELFPSFLLAEGHETGRLRSNSVNSHDNEEKQHLNQTLKELVENDQLELNETAKKKRISLVHETLAKPQYAKMRERLQSYRKHYGNERFRHFKQPSPTVLQSVRELEKADRSADKNVVHDTPTIRHVNQEIADLLIGGDMLLSNDHFENEHQSQQSSLSNRNRKKKRQLQVGLRRKWNPDIPISYYYDPTIDETTKRLIRISAEFWTQFTCMTFAENGRTQPRVRFFKGVGCYSDVGKGPLFGRQDVSIGVGCELFGTITHEMGHVLGLFHHQSRTDRDDFITLMLTNIEPYWRAQYAKEFFSENYGVNYDYGSIMHYSGYKPRTETIEMAANDKQYQHTMGNNYGPMFSDLLAINKYYNCAARCPSGADCKNFGFRNSRNCNVCICPNGFGGADCSERAPGEGDAPALCGETVEAINEWKTLNGSVVPGTYPTGRNSTDRSAGCHFHIIAPSGRQIYLELLTLSGTCSPDCYFGALDIKVADITKGGIRACCESHRADISTMKSTLNLVVLSLYTQRDTREFSLRYKIYDDETSTAPSTTHVTQLLPNAALSETALTALTTTTTTSTTTTTTTSTTTKAPCVNLAGFRCFEINFFCSSF